MDIGHKRKKNLAILGCADYCYSFFFDHPIFHSFEVQTWYWSWNWSWDWSSNWPASTTDVTMSILSMYKLCFRETIVWNFIVRISYGDKCECWTSDEGSQYRCGRVGMGIQSPSTPKPPTPHTNIHKSLFFHFSTWSTHTNGLTDQLTNGRTKPLIELRVCN